MTVYLLAFTKYYNNNKIKLNDESLKSYFDFFKRYKINDNKINFKQFLKLLNPSLRHNDYMLIKKWLINLKITKKDYNTITDILYNFTKKQKTNKEVIGDIFKNKFKIKLNNNTIIMSKDKSDIFNYFLGNNSIDKAAIQNKINKNFKINNNNLIFNTYLNKSL